MQLPHTLMDEPKIFAVGEYFFWRVGEKSKTSISLQFKGRKSSLLRIHVTFAAGLELLQLETGI